MQARSSRQNRLGRTGEEWAADYLAADGYEVIARNYRTRRAEIDVVARKGGIVVFVEVKHWSAFGLAELEYGIDQRKQARIIGASKLFMKEHSIGDSEVRYDVLFFGRNRKDVHHFPGAFSERA